MPAQSAPTSAGFITARLRLGGELVGLPFAAGPGPSLPLNSSGSRSVTTSCPNWSSASRSSVGWFDPIRRDAVELRARPGVGLAADQELSALRLGVAGHADVRGDRDHELADPELGGHPDGLASREVELAQVDLHLADPELVAAIGDVRDGGRRVAALADAAVEPDVGRRHRARGDRQDQGEAEQPRRDAPRPSPKNAVAARATPSAITIPATIAPLPVAVAHAPRAATVIATPTRRPRAGRSPATG